MGEEVEYPRCKAAHTEADHHVAELGDGRVGEYTLYIIFYKTDCSRAERRDGSDPGDDIQRAALEAADEGVSVMQQTAKGTSAFSDVTGDLRRSIKGLVAIVAGNVEATLQAGGDGVDYAIYVEEGSGSRGPRPFIRPAFEKGLPLFEALIADAMVDIGTGDGFG